jgi:hypothetical protein
MKVRRQGTPMNATSARNLVTAALLCALACAATVTQAEDIDIEPMK